MNDNDTSEDMVVMERTPNIGKQLRAAREEKGMNIQDVASQLRLLKGVVNDLEQDRWDNMGERIYARGYFASYVKFLELPYDEMMAAFEREYSVTEPRRKITREAVIEKKSFPWGGLFSALFLLLALSAGGWFLYQQWQKAHAEQVSLSEKHTKSISQQAFNKDVLTSLTTHVSSDV